MKLYYREDCPFCWKVRLALHELDLPYESIRVKLGERHEEVVALNPKATVPVLVDHDLVLWESSIIVQHLHESADHSTLLPSRVEERAKLRMLAHYSDAVIGPALRDTIFEKRSKGAGAWDQDLLAASERAWRRCLTRLESCIAGRMGFSAEFSVADCALLARFGLADHYGVGVDSRHPTLKAWYERMRRRRSFAATEPERPRQVKRKAAI